MNKSRIALTSNRIFVDTDLRARLMGVLPSNADEVSRLYEALEKVDHFERKLSLETREGGVAAKYLCSTLNREYSEMGDIFRVEYMSFDGGNNVMAEVTVNHPEASKIIAALAASIC